MKALTVKQPWANLICSGIKDIENRTWKCPEKYIGQRILIHAGSQIDKKLLTDEQVEYVNDWLFEHKTILLKGVEGWDRGAIIGSVVIKDCTINHPSIWAEKTKYIVELQYSCWICKWNGYPGGTLLMENAKTFTCEEDAKSALCDARKYKPFKNAKIIPCTYNWILEDAIKFEKPILNVKGKLSFWESSY